MEEKRTKDGPLPAYKVQEKIKKGVGGGTYNLFDEEKWRRRTGVRWRKGEK